ncbi:hypothetical protein HZH68_005087 [Vespula germanica]|uniref:Uncharacterized protein n=1 Tax=Vespula germanica TaxID=30212 RepID=A0A834KFD8_VESGE|nr:hypothetical protein HZH68_005087 [Vespula germanica]
MEINRNTFGSCVWGVAEEKRREKRREEKRREEKRREEKRREEKRREEKRREEKRREEKRREEKRREGVAAVCHDLVYIPCLVCIDLTVSGRILTDDMPEGI